MLKTYNNFALGKKEKLFSESRFLHLLLKIKYKDFLFNNVLISVQRKGYNKYNIYNFLPMK
jgi:hypothetical protein